MRLREQSRDALIRLLVAETRWLRSAPLSFPDCRDRLADLVLSLLTGKGTSLVVTMLLVCLGFMMLAPGVLAVLHIIDWFEARRKAR